MIAITKNNIEQEVYNSAKPVIMDIYAIWCGPCQYMKPIFEQLEHELGESYKFVTLNVDEARDLAIEFGVTTVPTFLFFTGKDIRGQETGYMSKEDFKSKIKLYVPANS